MVASLAISIIALFKSNQAIREKRRPRFDVVGLAVDRFKLEAFIGTESEISKEKVTKEFRLLKEKLSNHDYNELLSPKNFERNFIFPYEKENHWIINFIPRKTKPNVIDESVVIGFNALEVELEFDKRAIREIELIYGFTLIDAQSVIPHSTRLSVKLPLKKEQTEKGKLTIPFAYVSLGDHKKHQLLERKLLSQGEKANRIDVLTSEIPMKWLGFKETGYVFRLTTISNDTFDYSVIISSKTKDCYLHPISNGSKLFRERVKKAKTKWWKRIVQKSSKRRFR